MRCPKCGSEMIVLRKQSLRNYSGWDVWDVLYAYGCLKCGHEEKIGGEKDVH